MSQSDREYITALHDGALRNRLVDPSDRDTDISVAFIGLVEEYYGPDQPISEATIISTESPHCDNKDDQAIHEGLMLTTSVVKISSDRDPVTMRRISVASSPQFTLDAEINGVKSNVHCRLRMHG